VVGTTGKPRIRTLFCYNLRDDDEAYPNPETPRAAEAPNRGTLWQLDFTSELGLRFPKTKHPMLLAFLNLQRPAPGGPCSSYGRKIQQMQGENSSAYRKVIN